MQLHNCFENTLGLMQEPLICTVQFLSSVYTNDLRELVAFTNFHVFRFTRHEQNSLVVYVQMFNILKLENHDLLLY